MEIPTAKLIPESTRSSSKAHNFLFYAFLGGRGLCDPKTIDGEGKSRDSMMLSEISTTSTSQGVSYWLR
jgi:hypothetical protein